MLPCSVSIGSSSASKGEGPAGGCASTTALSPWREKAYQHCEGGGERQRAGARVGRVEQERGSRRAKSVALGAHASEHGHKDQQEPESGTPYPSRFFMTSVSVLGCASPMRMMRLTSAC